MYLGSNIEPSHWHKLETTLHCWLSQFGRKSCLNFPRWKTKAFSQFLVKHPGFNFEAFSTTIKFCSCIHANINSFITFLSLICKHLQLFNINITVNHLLPTQKKFLFSLNWIVFYSHTTSMVIQGRPRNRERIHRNPLSPQLVNYLRNAE